MMSANSVPDLPFLVFQWVIDYLGAGVAILARRESFICNQKAAADQLSMSDQEGAHYYPKGSQTIPDLDSENFSRLFWLLDRIT